MTKEILLSQEKVALVDDDDYQRLIKINWYAHKQRKIHYALCHKTNEDGSRGTEYMHRIIMKCPTNKVIDHINGDGLDNRKENLRIVSSRENCLNNVHKEKSSRYSGVAWHKSSKGWQSSIRYNGKFCYLGVFKNEFDAAIAYRVAYQVLIGDIPDDIILS